MEKLRANSKLTAIVVGLVMFHAAAASSAAEFLIHISVDGLRPDIVTMLGPTTLPNFYRLRHQGVFIENARSDIASTYTLPNHTSMLSGRPLDGINGHQYRANHFPLPLQTLHTRSRRYIASTFDVVHDHGQSTGLFAGKAKFVIFERSYNATNGASDLTGFDNGPNKIDTYVFDSNTAQLIDLFIVQMKKRPLNYSFLHFRDPDAAGHADTWNLDENSEYANAVRRVDSYLGKILQTIDDDQTLNTNTAIILTADHGGPLGEDNHAASDRAENYTIPFYVWGFEKNLLSHLGGDGDSVLAAGLFADASSALIFNGDSANLALAMLRLPAIPGSTLLRLRQRFQAITLAAGISSALAH